MIALKSSNSTLNLQYDLFSVQIYELNSSQNFENNNLKNNLSIVNLSVCQSNLQIKYPNEKFFI